ncbi:MAG: WecB/TagA/CpsF family glycosyltransferase [Thiohalomonadales bacterium]
MDNIERNVWCILGLPFDALNIDKVVDKLHHIAINKTPCFVSTPNLNFLIESQTDPVFRDSVINSELSVVDGKPLVWIARLLGIPISERVAGSDLIEEFIKNKGGYKPLKVFFFGGEAGIAESACEKLNSQTSGLQCVGNLYPGFGSIADMSSEDIINQINQNDADFVIVSLGAKKGQTWIERNRKQINAPLISHLGAVVNFIAGTVNRAPKFLQKIGMEWLWRIKEEPVLWKRYFHDAISFFYLLIFKVFPLFIIIRVVGKKAGKNKFSIELFNSVETMKIELSGSCSENNIPAINKIFKNVINSPIDGEVNIVIKDGAYVDAAFLAKILLLKNILSNNKRNLNIITESKLVDKIFRYNCCEYLLQR